jgi:hypothetical protein
MKHPLLLSFVLAVLLAVPAVLQAADPVKMIVWQTDGSQTILSLTDKPKVTCSDTLVIIRTDSVEVNYPLKKLRKFTFEIPTAVPVLQAAPQGRAVYDINGRLVTQEFDTFDDLPRGIYIVREGNVTYKVMRR